VGKLEQKEQQHGKVLSIFKGLPNSFKKQLVIAVGSEYKSIKLCDVVATNCRF
jgi:hypothetical protein